MTHTELKTLLETAYSLSLKAIEKKYFKKSRLDTLEGISLAIAMIRYFPEQAEGCNIEIVKAAFTA